MVGIMMREKNKMFGKLLKSTLAMLIMFILVIMSSAESISADDPYEEILQDIERIIKWKKSNSQTGVNEPLLNNHYLENAGETAGDWYPIGIGRIGYQDDYEAYLAVIEDVVSKRYEQESKLSEAKATEWHRISLAILSMGGDPTEIGQDVDGKPIDLIADGTYNRGKVRALGLQGVNGWIWGLIALDSMRYVVPADGYDQREAIIQEIMRSQLSDGGFGLNQLESDTDMTAMALQALAPYYNSEEMYTYELKETETEVTKTVREVVDGALVLLAETQQEDGDYASWEVPNAESTAQVIVALTALGIDPFSDERFIKNDQTLFDGLKKYQMDDGGFIHAATYDAENPSSLPDQSNTMASEQALYSLVALYRNAGGYRTLYDFRKEMEFDVKQQVNGVRSAIDQLPDEVTEKDAENIKEIFQDYVEIPIAERSYVFNYADLANAMKQLNIENRSEPIAEQIGERTSGTGAITPLFHEEANLVGSSLFTKEDAEKVQQLPERLTSSDYVEVTKLLNKLERAENREEYAHLIEGLSSKKTEIEKIQEEIEALNELILDDLYPFQKLTIKDKEKVEAIVKRFERLSEDDRKKIIGAEDIKKSMTKIDNLIRARMISIAIGVVIVITVAMFIMRRRKKKREKAQRLMIDEED